MSFMAVGSEFWLRVAPAQRRFDTDSGRIIIQRFVRVRNRYSINPSPADRARALTITYEHWRKKSPPRYIAASFKAGSPIFHCPGLVFAASQLVQAGTFERVRNQVHFVKLHTMVFETKESAYKLDDKLKRLAEKVPGTEYAGYLGKGKRLVRICVRERQQVAVLKRQFPRAKPFHPPRWQVSKPLIVKLTSAEVRALLWLRVSTAAIEPIPSGVARTLGRLSKSGELVAKLRRRRLGSQYRLTALGIKARGKMLSLGLSTDILPQVKAAKILVLSKPFVS